MFLGLCTATDFSAAEKGKGVMSLSHFAELWLSGSHGGGITSGMYAATNWIQAVAPGEAR